MYLKKVKINATTQRLKLVFQESKVNSKLGGMALQSADDERFGIITLEEGARHPEDHEDAVGGSQKLNRLILSQQFVILIIFAI